jgi:hypothetical protein
MLKFFQEVTLVGHHLIGEIPQAFGLGVGAGENTLKPCSLKGKVKKTMDDLYFIETAGDSSVMGMCGGPVIPTSFLNMTSGKNLPSEVPSLGMIIALVNPNQANLEPVSDCDHPNHHTVESAGSELQNLVGTTVALSPLEIMNFVRIVEEEF